MIFSDPIIRVVYFIFYTTRVECYNYETDENSILRKEKKGSFLIFNNRFYLTEWLMHAIITNQKPLSKENLIHVISKKNILITLSKQNNKVSIVTTRHQLSLKACLRTIHLLSLFTFYHWFTTFSFYSIFMRYTLNYIYICHMLDYIFTHETRKQ